MQQESNILGASDNAGMGVPFSAGTLSGADGSWSCVKVTPLPTGGGCYRSRIYAAAVSINPLVAACDQLLSLITNTTHFDYPEDRERFLHDLAHEIRAFEHRSQIANYSPWSIVIARYALCCLLDEVIADSYWGQQNDWLAKSLFTIFYNSEFDIARFFAVVEQALLDVPRNLHLIELIYLCLLLGFTGKYQGASQRLHEITALQERLCQISSSR